MPLLLACFVLFARAATRLSRSPLHCPQSLLAGGAGSHTTPIGAGIWPLLLSVSATDQEVMLQWVPAHCVMCIPGNEKADELAREAAGLQQEAPADVRTITGAVARRAALAQDLAEQPLPANLGGTVA